MDEKPRIPTKDDIHALPRWAKVAFLGRCAERMLPIIKKDWPDLPEGALFLIASAGGRRLLHAPPLVTSTRNIDRGLKKGPTMDDLGPNTDYPELEPPYRVGDWVQRRHASDKRMGHYT